MSGTRPARDGVRLAPAELRGSLPAETFKAAFRGHPSGVAVVTASHDGHPVAMTVSSLVSLSAEPPLLSFSASAQSSSTPVLEQVDTVVVHLVGSEQLWLARLGATSGIDRFADTSAWHRLPTGEPLFHGVDAWIRGKVVHRLDASNAVVYLVHALDACVPDKPSTPLVYHDRSWHRLTDSSAIGNP